MAETKTSDAPKVTVELVRKTVSVLDPRLGVEPFAGTPVEAGEIVLAYAEAMRAEYGDQAASVLARRLVNSQADRVAEAFAFDLLRQVDERRAAAGSVVSS